MVGVLYFFRINRKKALKPLYKSVRMSYNINRACGVFRRRAEAAAKTVVWRAELQADREFFETELIE